MSTHAHTQLDEVRAAAPALDWEHEGADLVGVRDGHTPREIVIQLRQIKQYGRLVWNAWLKSGPARGGCDFVATGLTIERAISEARRIFERDSKK